MTVGEIVREPLDVHDWPTVEVGVQDAAADDVTVSDEASVMTRGTSAPRLVSRVRRERTRADGPKVPTGRPEGLGF
jgi:hypothetical protein